MSRGGFGSLVMAASVAGAALGCYLVSLNVASERAELESVEADIVTTQREIRVLQTEIGTRGRLAQLERWNVNFIRLSAPTADQILEGSFQLASMVQPPAKPALEAPMVLASAPAETGAGLARAGTEQLLRVASFTLPVRGERSHVRPSKPPAGEPARPEMTTAGPEPEPKTGRTKTTDPKQADARKGPPNAVAGAKMAESKKAAPRPRPAAAKPKLVPADPLAPHSVAEPEPAEDNETPQ